MIPTDYFISLYAHMSEIIALKIQCCAITIKAATEVVGRSKVYNTYSKVHLPVLLGPCFCEGSAGGGRNSIDLRQSYRSESSHL